MSDQKNKKTDTIVSKLATVKNLFPIKEGKNKHGKDYKLVTAEVFMKNGIGKEDTLVRVTFWDKVAEIAVEKFQKGTFISFKGFLKEPRKDDDLPEYNAIYSNVFKKKTNEVDQAGIDDLVAEAEKEQVRSFGTESMNSINIDDIEF